MLIIFLIPMLVLLTALTILFTSRKVSVGVRVGYAALTLILPFAVAMTAPLLRGQPDWVSILWLLVVGASPIVVWSVFKQSGTDHDFSSVSGVGEHIGSLAAVCRCLFPITLWPRIELPKKRKLKPDATEVQYGAVTEAD